MALPTDYKDQVLDSTMDGLRQFAMIKNSNGTYSFRDVSTYSQTGSTLAASDVNAINTEINTIENDYSTLESPTFTGTPKAPTANTGTATTQIATTAFVTSAISAAIAGITQFEISIVDSLPDTGVKGTIYMVPSSSSTTQNVYMEYIWIDSSSSFELIGSTAIDLSNYVTLAGSEALTNKTYNGYTLGDACAKGVDSSVTSGSTNLITSGAVSSALENVPTSDTMVKHGASTAVGSATKGVYVASDGTATAMTYSVEKDVPSDAVFTDTTYSNVSTTAAGLAPTVTSTSAYLRGDGTWATPTNTKNTAGSTDSSSKLFLIGATSQAANPQTYSQDTAYVGTDGYLYSNSKKVFGCTEATGSLSANATSLTISNSAITTSSTIDVYSSVFGVNPTAMTIASGSVTFTFSDSHDAATIKIRIS